MKRKLFLLGCLLAISQVAQAQMTYTINACGYAPIAGVGTPLPTGDDIVSGAVPLGFTFNFYATNYTQCYVSSNGFLSFNAVGSGCCSGQLLPAAGFPNMIAWSWDDMYTVGGTVDYFTSGVAPNRIFVLNYNNVGYCCTSNNMASVQVQLYETSNEIRILSANNNHIGRTATMGIFDQIQGATPVPGRHSQSWATPANDCQLFIPGPLPPPPPPFCYSGGAIPYAPDPVGGTFLVLGDDQYSPVVNIGFSFCMDGTNYTQLLISSNSYVDFDLGLASGFSPYWITAPIPTNNPAEIMRGLLSPWQDIYPPGGGTVSYQTLGIAPNRRFVVTWNNVPMYSCTGMLFTGQLKLFETTNCAEIHIGSKPICAGWNGGQAIEGYNNVTGTNAWAQAGRNAPTQWTVTNDAIRMVPNCTPCSTAVTCTPPLPIELLSFDGICSNDQVDLFWATSSEINNNYFSVERSNDLVQFETLGTIQGAINSNVIQEYSFTDHTPRSGNTYYRLRQTDINGDFKYFDPISVNCAGMNLTIYPNPNLGIFKILGADAYSDLMVTDIFGKVVYQMNNLATSNDIDLSHLKSGVYFITIQSNNQSWVKKVVIN